MTDQPRAISATLREGSEERPFGADVSIGVAPLTVAIDIPPGVELERAELRVEAPDDSQPITVPAAVTTSAGPLKKDQSIEWISVDWGSRRPLALVRVNASGASKGRVKVAEGGPWFPPLPFEFIPFNKDVRLSGVTAVRVLIEPVDGDDPKVAAKVSANVSAIVVNVAARPPDLLASVNGGAPFFHRPLLLAPREVVVLRDELLTALRRAWPRNGSGGSVSVELSSSGVAKLQSVRLSLVTSVVVRAWEGGEDIVWLSIDPGERGDAAILPPLSGSLQSLAFTVESDPRPEVVPLRPAPIIEPLVGQHIGSGFRAAQGFSTPDAAAALAGIDLFLEPLTPSIKGTVAIYADEFGAPADAPIKKVIAELAVEATGGAPWPARWVNVDFASQIPVSDQLFWVALELSHGEALWLLGDTGAGDPKVETASRGILFQSGGDGVWIEREPPPNYVAVMPKPAAYARPRFFTTALPEAPEVAVRWGDNEIAASIGKGGRVTLDAKDLEALPRPGAGDVRIHVLVRSAVGAVVTLSNLELRAPRSADYP